MISFDAVANETLDTNFLPLYPMPIGLSLGPWAISVEYVEISYQSSESLPFLSKLMCLVRKCKTVADS